jgi:hypothetical protein
MDISIYLKSTGQIVSTRNINNVSEISHLEDEYGYVEGTHNPIFERFDGSNVVAYTPPYVSGTNTLIVRAERDKRLAMSDWTQAPDSPFSNSKKAEWVTYRQALRDLMASYSDSTAPEDVTWPTEPSA